MKKFAWAEVKSYKTSKIVRKTKFEVEMQQFGRLLTHAERKDIWDLLTVLEWEFCIIQQNYVDEDLSWI